MTFCSRFARLPTDLSLSNLMDYVTFLATEGKAGSPMSYATVKAHLDFLGRAASFTSPNQVNPVKRPEIKLFLRGVGKSLGKDVEKAEPATLNHLCAGSSGALRDPTNVADSSVSGPPGILGAWAR